MMILIMILTPIWQSDYDITTLMNCGYSDIIPNLLISVDYDYTTCSSMIMIYYVELLIIIAMTI